MIRGMSLGLSAANTWRKTHSDRPPGNPLLWPYWTLTGGYAVYIVTASTFTLQVLTLPDGTSDDVSSHLRAIVADPRYGFNGLAVNNPNWEEDYFGENYASWRETKGRWDPEGLFYGKTTVGSDEWEIDDEGRLCKLA
ncbi:putative fad binding domain-containing protein [Neofusicoccum parvum UCRNP2]|uniref:Putative fad binding domain-containing protein n=1 Tax=Botryosphaeria parva (strain UCR-NP2) TaxID=1287680 RepID=R1GW94_BOTPV|nr:putative fad binding domain-containing protein [Neofusicoccum parvum UCRNP2]